MRRLVIGCGYLGQRVAAEWQERGDEVFVTTRSRSRATELNALNFTPIVADVTDADSLRRLPRAETVLFAVGFDRTSGHAIESVYVGGLSNTVKALDEGTNRFIYISSTGVYGQSQGEWVDESSACQPTRPGGKACLAAEQLLQASPLADKAIILRLAGIYGPGRVPNIRALRTAQPVIAPAASYLNLIHVEDATMAVIATDQSATPSTYVVSDNRPVLRREYYRELARWSGLDPDSIEFVENPPQPPADAASEQRSQRQVGSKRVRSDHILRTLDLRWRFPDYQAGLAAVLDV